MTAESRKHRPKVATLAVIATALAALPGPVAIAQEFSAILAAPDETPLNLAYAQQQAREGELAVAASALERILINDPDQHSVRLFYAVVLYRLGDLQGARDQLRRLEAVNLPPQQRAEAQNYARRIEQGLAAQSLRGSLTAGLSYEDDAAGAYFTAFDLIGAPPPEEGLSGVLALNLEARTDIGSTRTWEAFASGTLYDQSGLSGAAVDFQRAGLDLGLYRTTRLTRSRLAGVLRHVRLEGEPQLTEAGGRFDTRWRVTNATALSLRAEAVSQDYDEPAIEALAPLLGGDRDGARYQAGVGVSHRLTARTTLTGGVDYEVKTAGYEPFGYAGPKVSAGLDQRFDRGVYVAASGSVRWLDYDQPDTAFLGGATREDVRSSARLAMGAPLSAFSTRGATGDVRENIILEGAVNYSRRESSAPLADFDGWGAELRLIWRFGPRE